MKAVLFTNDRKVKFKRVNGSKLWFNYRGKLYDIDPEKVVMEEEARIIEIEKEIEEDKIQKTREIRIREKRSKPILVYFENSSEPIGYTKDPAPDPTRNYFEKYLKLNNVRTTGKQSLMSRLLPGLQRILGLFTIQNFVMLVLVGSMLYEALRSVGYL